MHITHLTSGMALRHRETDQLYEVIEVYDFPGGKFDQPRVKTLDSDGVERTFPVEWLSANVTVDGESIERRETATVGTPRVRAAD